MKKTFTLGSKLSISTLFTVLAFTAFSQKGENLIGTTPKEVSQTDKQTYSVKLTPEEAQEANANKNQQAKSAALANCTDLVDFVGTTSSYYDNVGGPQQNSSQYKARGVIMLYPKISGITYKGTLLGVVFKAATHLSQTTANMDVDVYDLNQAGTFASGAFLGSGPVQVSGTTPTEYTVTFSTPIPINSNNGFAVGVSAASTSDSCKVYEGANMGSGTPYGNVLTWPNYLYTFSGANRINVYPLIRPIITTTVSPNWVSAKTSTTCGAPAVYNFTNTNTATTPSYNVHFMISPTLAISRSLNYGDGSSAVSFPNGSTKTNTYTQLGNFTAIYTETYYGWNANCAVSLNQPIVVDNPIPAFTYTTNGLTVTLNNSSANNLSGFVWSFGDLGTSTQQQPGTHTYSSPGTYVIELEANAPCGKVRYSVSVTVPSNSSGGATGIAEASNNGSAFISLSPNPSNAHITITNNGTQSLNGKIEIYNSLGACVKTIQEESLSQGQTTISIEGLPAGVYFMKLHNQQGDVVKSFVKN